VRGRCFHDRIGVAAAVDNKAVCCHFFLYVVEVVLWFPFHTRLNNFKGGFWTKARFAMDFYLIACDLTQRSFK
jgi:hypothetical protein